MSRPKALITGASSGIGAALAHSLTNYDLLLVGRDLERLEGIAEAAGGVAIQADLATHKGRQLVLDLVRTEAPELVINGAGFGMYGPALDHATAEQVEQLEVNAVVPLEITLEAARAMKRAGKKGTILNIASATAYFIYPNNAVYAASKGCMVSYSRALNDEFRADGIRVLVSCPGMVASGFGERASKRFQLKASSRHYIPTEKVVDQILRQIAKGKEISIIDWRYRLVCLFLPQTLVRKVLRGRLSP